jgi:Tetratricopeptide repeat
MRSLSSPALLLSFALTVLPLSLFAQKGGGKGASSRPSAPAIVIMPDNHPTRDESEFDRKDATNRGLPKPQLKSEQPSCFHWPMSPILSSAVSVNGMKIPDKAREEFDQGCAAARKKSNEEAQKHLNRAVKTYPAFAEAWVLLGQTEKESGKTAEAEQSCTQGRQADANYLPAYLCLADIAAREQKWSQVADFTNQVIALHPVKAPPAFYYNCLANFYLNQFDAAEQSGLRAEEEGNDEQKTQMYLLLAKIYERKGDRASEANQLRNFLKLAPHDPNADTARHILLQIADEGKAAASTPSQSK